MTTTEQVVANLSLANFPILRLRVGTFLGLRKCQPDLRDIMGVLPIRPTSLLPIRTHMKNNLQDALVMICNLRGSVVWTDHSESQVVIGEPCWQDIAPENDEVFKSDLAKAISLRKEATLECKCKSGNLHRIWIWPLHSPELSVCLLRMKLPNQLRELTNTERKLMRQMSKGKSVRQIATIFDVSISTVHTHLYRVREKLNVDTQEALYGFAGKYCSTPEIDQNGKVEDFENHVEKDLIPTKTNPENLEGALAIICDWRGTIVWRSETGLLCDVGDPAWKFIRDDYKELAKEFISRVVTFQEPQLGEGFNVKDNYFRTYCWPLLSPKAAVFTLLIKLPAKLSRLDTRE